MAGLERVLGLAQLGQLNGPAHHECRDQLPEHRRLPRSGRAVHREEAGPLIQLPLKIGEVVAPTHLDTGQSIAPLIVPQELVANLPTHGAPTKVGTKGEAET